VTTLIFDCDGVLADTERYGHLPAFNQTFTEFGLPVQWSEEEYGACSSAATGADEEPADARVRGGAGRRADPEARPRWPWHKRKTPSTRDDSPPEALPPGIRESSPKQDAGWKLASHPPRPSISPRHLDFAVSPEPGSPLRCLPGR
jgi:hypothetical protein